MAQRVPAIKSEKNLKNMNEKTMARNGIVKSIDFMMKNPMQGNKMWDLIEANLFDKVEAPTPQTSQAIVPMASQLKSPDKNVEVDLSACVTWGKIPQAVRTAIVCSVHGAPDAETTKKMLNEDPMCFDDIAEMALQVRKSDHIPQEARVLHILKLMACARARQVGNRLIGWVVASVNEQFKIDWNAKPLFQPAFKNGVLASIKHVPTGDEASPPTHLKIDRDWKLENPVSDDAARFTIGDSHEYIKGWFISTAGPNKYSLDKKGDTMKEIANTAGQSFASKSEALIQEITCPVIEFDDPRKRQRSDALEKARKVRKENILAHTPRAIEYSVA